MHVADDSVKRRRRKSGGSKKTNYVEGWVEFLNKKHAKAVAAALNNRKVGGKRRSFHYEDTWNMKYLPKFKWNHLTQKIGACYRLANPCTKLTVDSRRSI